MTFATSSAAAHSEPRWCVEFTSGATTLRYSSKDLAIAGVGFVAGRVAACSQVTLSQRRKLDLSGPDITLLDPDNVIETAGLTKGWVVTFKIGFADLAYASWTTWTTYEVADRPRRQGFTLQVRTVSRLRSLLGALSDMPRIASGDAYLFGTLDCSQQRIGELLPFRFGAHGAPGGSIEPTYLGYDFANARLVWCVGACDAAATPLWSVLEAFVNGVYLGTVTYETITTGAYKYLIFALGLDEAARLGVVAQQTGKKATLPPLLRDRLRPSKSDKSHDLLSDVSVKVNASLGWSKPVSLLTYLFTYHGPGIAYAPTLSTEDTYLVRNAITIAGVIDRGTETLADICDGVSAECDLLQSPRTGSTAPGYYNLMWSQQVSQAHAASGELGSHSHISDLVDIVGQPHWADAGGDDLSPINTITIKTAMGEEQITDSAALTAYGSLADSVDNNFVKAASLAKTIAWDQIQRRKTPRTVASYGRSLDAINDGLGTAQAYNVVTARGAPAAGGWSGVTAQLQKIDLNPVACEIQETAVDTSQRENTASAYMEAESTYSQGTVASCVMTSGAHSFTTTDDAQEMFPGRFVYLQTDGTDRSFCAMILSKTFSTPTYTIFTDRAPTFSATVTLTVLSMTSTTPDGLIGRSDSTSRNINMQSFLTSASLTECFSLADVSSTEPVSSFASAPRVLTVTGGPLTADTTYAIARAAPTLNGTSQYLSRASNDADLTILGEMSCGCWIRPASTGGIRSLIDFAGTSSVTAAQRRAYKLSVTAAGALRREWEDTAGNNWIDSSADGLIVDGSVYFVAMTRDGDGISKLYIGTPSVTPALVRTSFDTLLPGDCSSAKLRIGADARAGNLYHSGMIGLCWIRDIELSASAITTLWTNSHRQASAVVV